jgi:hypothetical protein
VVSFEDVMKVFASFGCHAPDVNSATWPLGKEGDETSVKSLNIGRLYWKRMLDEPGVFQIPQIHIPLCKLAAEVKQTVRPVRVGEVEMKRPALTSAVHLCRITLVAMYPKSRGTNPLNCSIGGRESVINEGLNTKDSAETRPQDLRT